MMTGKHTPGPWSLEDRGYKFIVHKHGEGYVTRDVCRLDGSTMSAFNQAANAHLIAAAPDLLEVVEDAVDAWETHCESGDMMQGDWVRDARAAIAKARGQE